MHKCHCFLHPFYEIPAGGRVEQDGLGGRRRTAAVGLKSLFSTFAKHVCKQYWNLVRAK